MIPPSELICFLFPLEFGFYSKLGEMILIGLLLLWCSSGVWRYSHQSPWPYFLHSPLMFARVQTGGDEFLCRVIHVWCNYGLCGCSLLSPRLYNIFPKVVCLQQPQGNSLLYSFRSVMQLWVVMALPNKAHIMILFTHWFCYSKLLGSKSKGGIQHMVSRL